MLNAHFPQPQFQGISQLKYHDTAVSHVSPTTAEEDARLLKLLDRVIATHHPSSFSIGAQEVNYRLPGDVFLNVHYLDDGLEVFLTSPEIKKTENNDYRSYLFLTYGTVSESLHPLLKKVRTAVGAKLSRSQDDYVPNAASVRAVVDQTIGKLSVLV